jgi:ligand-binding sensor domain-containing protein
MRHYCYWLVVCLFAFQEAKAQTSSILKDLRIEHLTTEQGLASNTISTILQDNKGFIWLLTSVGLNRYDGHDFKFYGYSAKDLNSITPGWFDGIIDRKNDVIWLSDITYRHLYSFLPASEKFILYDYQPGQNNSGYQGIESDSTGTLWMATTTGLESNNPKTKKNHTYTHIPGDTTTISSSNISQIEKDENGKIWLLVKKNNRCQIDYFDPYIGKVIGHITDNTLMPPSDPNFKPVDHNASPGDYNINTGKNGNLWIAAGQNGLYKSFI